MQKARRHPSRGLRPLVSARFQVLLHSAVRGSFHLSLTVLVHYRSLGSIQPWRMVPPVSDRVSPAPPYSGFGYDPDCLRIRGFHALRPPFPGRSPGCPSSTSPSFNPGTASTAPVWAPPLSLAATRGITVVFFSSGYLDVSVPRVGPTRVVACLPHAGFPHSGTRGSTAICASPRLFAACHALLRLREPRHPPYALS